MKAIKFILRANQNQNFPVLLLKNNELVRETELSPEEVKLVIKSELVEQELIDHVREATKLFRASSVKITKLPNY